MAFTKTSWLGAGSYSAGDDRTFAGDICEGVLPAWGGSPQNALAVTQRGVGANWSVDIATGWAIIQGDDGTNQGVYKDYNSATYNLTNSGQAPATFPRVDIVVARINDAEWTVRTPAGAMYFEFLIGTPTSGANATNRLGAPAVPPSAIHLADVVVQTSSSNISNAMITEKRKLSGPLIWGEDGFAYRLGVSSSGQLGLEKLT